MGLIGINQVSPQNTRRPGVLDRVFQGLDTATKVLGTGIQAYQANTQANLANAQIQNLGMNQNIEAYKAGGIMTPPVSGASAPTPGGNQGSSKCSSEYS